MTLVLILDIDVYFVTWLLYVCFRWSSFYLLKITTTKRHPISKQMALEKKRTDIIYILWFIWKLRIKLTYGECLLCWTFAGSIRLSHAVYMSFYRDFCFWSTIFYKSRAWKGWGENFWLLNPLCSLSSSQNFLVCLFWLCCFWEGEVQALQDIFF
jgi:hypothetical protein